MATFLYVTQGPDSGRDFEVFHDTVRIGNDSTANLRLNDPQLDGNLIVRWENGIYHVTNRLTYPIYLDGKPFPVGEDRVWFDGTSLQPTAATAILLKAQAETAQTPDRTEAAVAETTEVRPENNSVVRTIRILLIGIGLLILLASLDSGNQLSTAALERNTAEINKHLKAARNTPGHDESVIATDWQLLEEAFFQARIADRAGDHRAAAILYLKCSQITEVIRKRLPQATTIESSKEHDHALTKITALVNQRKLKLSD